MHEAPSLLIDRAPLGSPGQDPCMVVVIVMNFSRSEALIHTKGLKRFKDTDYAILLCVDFVYYKALLGNEHFGDPVT